MLQIEYTHSISLGNVIEAVGVLVGFYGLYVRESRAHQKSVDKIVETVQEARIAIEKLTAWADSAMHEASRRDERLDSHDDAIGGIRVKLGEHDVRLKSLERSTDSHVRD